MILYLWCNKMTQPSEGSQGTELLDVQALGDCAKLRGVLDKAEYYEGQLANVADLDRPGVPLDITRGMLMTEADTPFNTLVRLFVLGQAVPEEKLRRNLAPADMEPLVKSRLLQAADGGWKAVARLLPFERFWLLSDFDSDITGRSTPADQVMAVSLSSVLLTQMTVRRQEEKVLDLGTGNGIQGLSCTGHAKQIVGTDTNLRALNFARFNAQLNGISFMEMRPGSLFDPIGDETFDLLVANPPFAISPGRKLVYRDSNMPGDSLCEHVVRNTGKHLNDDGFAVIMFDWHHPTPEDWAVRPLQWAEGTGCDAWLMRFYSRDPVTYATEWLGTMLSEAPEEYQRQVASWLKYYNELGIGALSRGVIVLHKRQADKNWFRSDTHQLNHQAGSCSGQIQRIFACYDLLTSLANPLDLLNHVLRLAPGHQLQQIMEMEGGRWHVRRATLRQTQGFEFIGNIDQFVSKILAGCDGTRPLGQLIQSLAQELNAPVDRLAPPAVELMRTLMEKAYFEVVS